MKKDKKYTLIGLDIEWNNVILSSEFDKCEVHHYLHKSFRKVIEGLIIKYKNKKRTKMNISIKNAFDIRLCQYKAIFKNVERSSEVYCACIKEVNGKKLEKLIETGNMDLKAMLDCIDKKFFFNTMKSALNFMKHRYKNNTICYCHNLNAELSSILTELQGNDIKNTKKINAFGINPSTSVFRDKNTPLSVTFQEMDTITFKCSYALTDKSIETLGKEFTKEFKRLGHDINFEKLNYKYEKYRSPLEERTAEEKQYNERDVDISLLAVIRECVIRKCNINELPLTFTAGIKRDRNNYIQEYVEMFTDKKNAKSYLNILSKEKDETRLSDFNFYNLIFNTRQGGLTTGNFEFYKMINHNVFSYDIKSSYPYQMIYKRFPIYSKDNTFYYEGERAQEIINHLKDKTTEEIQEGTIKGFVGIFTLTNIKSNFDSNILCISKAKLINHSNIKCVNGKVLSADFIKLRLNESDLEGIKELYSFSDIIAHEVYCTTKLHRINKAERFFLMKNFLIKEKMEKDTIDYILSKVRINGMYGIKSQVEIRGYVDIKDGNVLFVPFDDKLETEIREKVYENFLEDTNINRNYDIFTDGMYIPSYAKLYLIKTMRKLEKDITKEIQEMNKDYVCRILYCDTDSIKFTVKEKRMSSKSSTIYNDIKPMHITFVTSIISRIFEKYNSKIINDNKNFLMNNCKDFIIKYNVLENEIKTLSKLGIFECENRNINGNIIPIESFISLGAKKYAYIDWDKDDKKDKIVTRIAGCSKDVSKAITKYSEVEGITLEEALRNIFICGMKFDETCSGRTVAYKEKHSKEELKDLGVIGSGGLHISKTSYTLNMTNDDKATIKFIIEDMEDDDLLGLCKYPVSNINENGLVSDLSYK